MDVLPEWVSEAGGGSRASGDSKPGAGERQKRDLYGGVGALEGEAGRQAGWECGAVMVVLGARLERVQPACWEP